MKPDHDLDFAGTSSGPPQFGVTINARCAEPPDAIVTWRVHQAGGDELNDGIATCFDGSFGAPGTVFTVTGCGSHLLVITPQELSDDGSTHPASASLRFEFTTCR